MMHHSSHYYERNLLPSLAYFAISVGLLGLIGYQIFTFLGPAYEMETIVCLVVWAIFVLKTFLVVARLNYAYEYTMVSPYKYGESRTAQWSLAVTLALSLLLFYFKEKDRIERELNSEGIWSYDVEKHLDSLYQQVFKYALLAIGGLVFVWAVLRVPEDSIGVLATCFRPFRRRPFTLFALHDSKVEVDARLLPQAPPSEPPAEPPEYSRLPMGPHSPSPSMPGKY